MNEITLFANNSQASNTQMSSTCVEQQSSGAYIRREDQGTVQEDGIVLGHSKVMHHDPMWDGDGHAGDHTALWVYNLVHHMRLRAYIVAKEKHLACKQHSMFLSRSHTFKFWVEHLPANYRHNAEYSVTVESDFR